MTIGIIDVILILFMLALGIKGIFNGFIMAAVGILGIVLGFIFAFMIETPMIKLVSFFGLKDGVASVSAYILSFLVIYLIVLILGHIIQKAIDFIRLGWLNRILGFLFGCLKGAAIASIILWAIVYFIPNDSKVTSEIKSSSVAVKTMKIVPFVYDKLNGMAGLDRINPFK